MEEDLWPILQPATKWRSRRSVASLLRSSHVVHLHKQFEAEIYGFMVHPQGVDVFLHINCFSYLSQITKGYEFESETDTEVIPKLIKYVYDNRENDNVTFSTLVERVIPQLVSRSHKSTTHTSPLYGSSGVCVCVCVCVGGGGVVVI